MHGFSTQANYYRPTHPPSLAENRPLHLTWMSKALVASRVIHEEGAQQIAPLQDYIVFIYNILMSNYITIFQLHHQFSNYNNTSYQLHHFHSITIIVLFNYNNDDHTITTIPWNDNNSSITITLHFNYNTSIQLQ